MASSSSSSLLRSVARELRRSIPPPRPLPAMSVMDRLAPRLLSTESSNHKMNPSSSSPLLDNFFRSDRAKRMDTSKVQFSKDDLKEFDRYLDERTKRAERNLLLSLDKFCDACERRASLLRDIKAMLEARNKRSAQKFLLVKQWAVDLLRSNKKSISRYRYLEVLFVGPEQISYL
uniref:Uncharacterized protein n=1 Tax=Oryza barthii TaxID=65489 RepID=A0A0D3H6J4_9ORYZ